MTSRTARLPSPSLAALALGALLAVAPAARAMDVKVVGDAVILTGTVVGDEPANVRIALAGHPDIRLAILRNSYGGNSPAGYRVGELFRERGITTAVSGYCLSSCSRMFLGGAQRVFTDDYPPLRTYVGFHGHYDARGRLDVAGVRAYGLHDWTVRHSDGKADEALVQRWISIESGLGAVNFLHPDVAASRGASVFACTGNEKNRPLGCEALATNALDQGVITDTRRVSSPDQAALPHRSGIAAHRASGYAEIGDYDKVPLDVADGVENYKLFLVSGEPRAFAVAATRRHWASSANRIDAADVALRRCAERAGEPCTLYALDQVVVYVP
jgi:hypothetical protein